MESKYIEDHDQFKKEISMKLVMKSVHGSIK